MSAEQKMAFAGHVLRVSSGKSVFTLLECKWMVKSERPRHTWIDDIKSWTKLHDCWED